MISSGQDLVILILSLRYIFYHEWEVKILHWGDSEYWEVRNIPKSGEEKKWLRPGHGEVHLLYLGAKIGQHSQMIWLVLGRVPAVISLQLEINHTEITNIPQSSLILDRICHLTLSSFLFFPSSRELRASDCDLRWGEQSELSNIYFPSSLTEYGEVGEVDEKERDGVETEWDVRQIQDLTSNINWAKRDVVVSPWAGDSLCPAWLRCAERFCG